MTEFDPGYGSEPFLTLVREAPGAEVYPADDFRLEWGPIFSRGRLDGPARVLVIGQDPAAHEAIARRILIGAAGQRVQAFLARLGVDRSYVMVNALLYSVYGQSGGERHVSDDAVVAYRNRWLEAVLTSSPIEAVVAFGHLAETAWRAWRDTGGPGAGLPFRAVPHPTQPESSAGDDPQELAEAYRRLLTRWNAALTALHPCVEHPDTPRPLEPFDVDAPPPTAAIPPDDLPAETKRATIVVTVPPAERPWHAR
jgi:uracil-DNA glycosylase